MLDRERRKVNVRNQVGGNSGLHDELSEGLRVALSRLWDPDDFTGQPRFHLLPCISHRLRLLEHPRIRDESEKGEQASP